MTLAAPMTGAAPSLAAPMTGAVGPGLASLAGGLLPIPGATSIQTK
jgi:hypothetical protein